MPANVSESAPEAGAPGKELELALAEAVLSALRAASRQPYIVGDVLSDPDVLIDGTFNFRVVGRVLRNKLGKLVAPTK
jgi:hypothetical protein